MLLKEVSSEDRLLGAMEGSLEGASEGALLDSLVGFKVGKGEDKDKGE